MIDVRFVFAIYSIAPLLSFGAMVEVYSQAGCADCEWVRESFLPKAEARFGTNLESRVRDIAEKENFLRLLGVLDRAGVEDDESVYLVLDGAEVLEGRAAIERDGLAALERLSGCPAPPRVRLREFLTPPRGRAAILFTTRGVW